MLPLTSEGQKGAVAVRGSEYMAASIKVQGTWRRHNMLFKQ